jgi:hypothetical protein
MRSVLDLLLCCTALGRADAAAVGRAPVVGRFARFGAPLLRAARLGPSSVSVVLLSDVVVDESDDDSDEESPSFSAWRDDSGRLAKRDFVVVDIVVGAVELP